MPWTIETKAPDCKGFAVVDAKGKTVGCHTSRKDALAHQRALYVNVKDVTQKDDPSVSSVHVDTIMRPSKIKKPELTKSIDSLITQHDKLHTMTDLPTDAQLYVHHAIMDAIDKAGQDVDCSCGVWSEPLLLNSVSTTFDALAKSDNPSLSPVASIIQSGIDQGYKFADVLHMLDVGGYMMVVRPKIIEAPEMETETEPTPDIEMTKSFVERFKNLLKEIGLPSLNGTVVGGGTTTLKGTARTVFKADEKRFTLGPWYIPDQQDAHGEWTDSIELQQGLWDYVKSGDRRIRLQHNKDVVAGEWVETMTWPYAVTVPMQQADGSSKDVTYPAGTVFMGVIWETWAWELVKAGKLTGYSIGGKSERMMVDLPEETSIIESSVAKHGTHDQKTHGRGKAGVPSTGEARAGMGDIKITDEMAAEMQGGSAAPFLQKNANGEWEFTPERQALHDKIVSESVDGIPSSDNPTYVVMGGGPAAGKSTILESGEVQLPKNTVEVNADNCKTKLPEWETAGANRASVTHAESSYLAKRTQGAAFERQQNIVLDGTGDTSAKSMTGKIDTAHAAGYKVEAHYVTLPTDMAVSNALARGKVTGRYVPEEVIRTTHAGVSNTFPAVADKFDSVKLYDTTKFGAPKLIATGAGGALEVIDQVAYDAFLAKGKP